MPQPPARATRRSSSCDNALIGLIDGGVDVLHRAFQDDVGRSRILAIWDQRGTAGPAPSAVDPAHFPLLDYGTVYLTADIARFVQGAPPPVALRDPGAHGTHVASIAAGRAVNVAGGGPSEGMAPDARLVVVIPNMRTNPGEPPSIGYSASHVDALTFLRRVRTVALPFSPRHCRWR